MLTRNQKPIRGGAMRIAVLTSVETRHRFFVRAIQSQFSVVAAAYARPSFRPAQADDSDLTPKERAIVADHFVERDRQEESFFGHDAEFLTDRPNCAVLRLEPGQLNTPAMVEFLRRAHVDTVIVLGTDLIKPPLLSTEWSMINLHLGLSPYYRGTATNFYPLLNEEPQYVGATIHWLDAGIDSGPILQHARPDIVLGDGPHTIGCKAIMAGIDAMTAVVWALERGERLEGVAQWHEPHARMYYRKDYHPRQVVELYEKWNDGLLERYLAGDAAHQPRLIRCCPTASASV